MRNDIQLRQHMQKSKTCIPSKELLERLESKKNSIQMKNEAELKEIDMLNDYLNNLQSMKKKPLFFKLCEMKIAQITEKELLKTEPIDNEYLSGTSDIPLSISTNLHDSSNKSEVNRIVHDESTNQLNDRKNTRKSFSMIGTSPTKAIYDENCRQNELEKIEIIKNKGIQRLSLEHKELRVVTENDEIPNICSEKISIFSCFVASSYKNGKKFNFDRIAINLNLQSNIILDTHKNINCFSIFDGIRAPETSEFLKQNFHNYLMNEEFNEDPLETILKTYRNLDKSILSLQINKDLNMEAGSSSINCLTIDDNIFITNLGDSRGILCYNNFSHVSQISEDHNTSSLDEIKRIKMNKGKLLRAAGKSLKSKKFIVDDVFTSKTRFFGETLLKSENQSYEIISSTPDILGFKYNQNLDFIFLGTSSIYKILNNNEVVYNVLESTINCLNYNFQLPLCLEKISGDLKNKCSAIRDVGNMSFIILFFGKFKEKYETRDLDYFSNCLINLKNSKRKNHTLLYDKEIIGKYQINNRKDKTSFKKKFLACIYKFLPKKCRESYFPLSN